MDVHELHATKTPVMLQEAVRSYPCGTWMQAGSKGYLSQRRMNGADEYAVMFANASWYPYTKNMFKVADE